MDKKAVIYGGGTVSHVRPHLAIAAPAYGSTAKYLAKNLIGFWQHVDLKLTKMAGGDLETNDDVKQDLEKVILDPTVKLVIFSAALCDFNGFVNDNEGKITVSGKEQPRLSSGCDYNIKLYPSEKLINSIRKERKDIFLVGFKTVSDVSDKIMFERGLNLLKASSSNLVFVNDIHRRVNAIVTPEMAVYGYSTDRKQTLETLINLINSRAGNTFTRTIMGEECLLSWSDVPKTLRTVVDYCADHGAYKPFRKVTVGHFGYRPTEGLLYSSRRKKDYTCVQDRDLVRVEFMPDGTVLAGGHKPSAGARSQYSILDDKYNCVVHFHCPLKPNHKDNIPLRYQFKYECGSHECGMNTKAGLLGDIRPGIRAVMLDKHGPNIIFNESMDAHYIIEFIEDNFDLNKQAGLSE